MVGQAMEQINLFPQAQAVLDEQGTAPDMGEDQGIPLMEHQHVTELGEGNIPSPLVIEVEVEDSDEDGLVEVELTRDAQSQRRCEGTITMEDLPHVALSDSEDEMY